MLRSLAIRDFVIVEHADLEFEGGFTAFTGETGAGKSLLIDALEFVLGGRAEGDWVREGASRAEVAAEFQCTEAAWAWLAEQDFPSAADGDRAHPGTVLVRRTLDVSGRSRAFLDGAAATLAQLRAFGAFVLDVHGQHEHQSLLRPAAQQRMLDDHGGLTRSVADVAASFARWRDARRAVEEAESGMRAAQDQRERLTQIAADLEHLAPEPGEWERIETEQKRLAHGATLIEGARSALDAIAEADDSLQSRLARIAGQLSALLDYDARLQAACDAVEAATIQLDEAQRELAHYLSRSELDEARLAYVEGRVAALHAAARRWRCAPAQLHEELAQAQAQLRSLDQAEDMGALRDAARRAEEDYRTRAAALSAARAQAADAMSGEVTRAMQDLAMAGGRFEVRLQAGEPSAYGTERVEFLVAAHAAGTARPLAKVASGGELSRIGLAISVIAASANPVPTLIFDEVDAGIGGQTAAVVGRLLRQLGGLRQVFCVTHLPQVAASAEHHFTVRKSQHPDGRPLSQTERLDDAARIEEVARMLGGAEITSLTRRHAREMIGSR